MKSVDFLLMIVSLIGSGEATDCSQAASIPAFVRACSIVNASMVTVQLGLAAEFLVAGLVVTDENRLGLGVKSNIVCYLSVVIEGWWRWWW
jgi:hypothetical protein